MVEGLGFEMGARLLAFRRYVEDYWDDVSEHLARHR